jgi:hypothetical protein
MFRVIIRFSIKALNTQKKEPDNGEHGMKDIGMRNEPTSRFCSINADKLTSKVLAQKILRFCFMFVSPERQQRRESQRKEAKVDSRFHV